MKCFEKRENRSNVNISTSRKSLFLNNLFSFFLKTSKLTIITLTKRKYISLNQHHFFVCSKSGDSGLCYSGLSFYFSSFIYFEDMYDRTSPYVCVEASFSMPPGVRISRCVEDPLKAWGCFLLLGRIVVSSTYSSSLYFQFKSQMLAEWR